MLFTYLQRSSTTGESDKAYSVLRCILSRHPPTTEALQHTYLQALSVDGKADGMPSQHWDFLSNVIRSVYSSAGFTYAAVKAFKAGTQTQHLFSGNA